MDGLCPFNLNKPDVTPILFHLTNDQHGFHLMRTPNYTCARTTGAIRRLVGVSYQSRTLQSTTVYKWQPSSVRPCHWLEARGTNYNEQEGSVRYDEIESIHRSSLQSRTKVAVKERTQVMMPLLIITAVHQRHCICGWPFGQ